MPVHVGTAGLGQAAQAVEAGDVEHQAHVARAQQRSQELTDGGLQGLQAVAVREAQEVQQRLLPRLPQVGPARVQVMQQHGEGLRVRLLQPHLSLRNGLTHPSIQQGSAGRREKNMSERLCGGREREVIK